MLTYEQVKTKPEVLCAMTSLYAAEFEKLAVIFGQMWEQYREAHPTTSQPRQRRRGGGRKATLATPEDKLFFILFYLKTYPLQEVFAFLFGMEQSTACTWLHELSAVLKLTLAQLEQLPQRQPPLLTTAAETAIPAVTSLASDTPQELALDGTERRRQRPKDSNKQEAYYSGKKHAHTVKNNVIAGVADKHIYYLSDTYVGKTQDKKICDEEPLQYAPNTILYQDKGFQGHAPAEVIVQQPKKKPRGRDLPAEEQIRNSLISRIRIVIENIIASIKRCRIVKDVFRNTKADFDDLVMELACGLHNFRTAERARAT